MGRSSRLRKGERALTASIRQDGDTEGLGGASQWCVHQCASAAPPRLANARCNASGAFHGHRVDPHQMAGSDQISCNEWETLNAALHPLVQGACSALLGRGLIDRAGTPADAERRGEFRQRPVTDESRVVGQGLEPTFDRFAVRIFDPHRNEDAGIEIDSSIPPYSSRIRRTRSATVDLYRRRDPVAAEIHSTSSTATSGPPGEGEVGASTAVLESLATGLPRRVIVTSSPASARSTNFGRLFLASAME